jgi:hypothetical protein
VGPPSHPSFYVNQERFSDILRQRWNAALARAVNTVQETDWAEVGVATYEGGKEVVQRLVELGGGGAGASAGPNSASHAAASAKNAANSLVAETSAAGSRLSDDITRGARSLGRTVQDELDALRTFPGGGSGGAAEAGSVRGTDYVGGSEMEVRTKRTLEKQKRMV